MIYRYDIQGLRGIAVLLVLIYHLNQKIISGGFIGVDIFFVISGFLVCGSIEQRKKKHYNNFYSSFYAGRVRRLYPASALTIFSVSLYVYNYDCTYFAIYKNDAIASLFIYSNYNYYFNQVDYFHSNFKESYLLHYWSLSLEEQFYFIIPFFIKVFYFNVIILYVIIIILSFSICVIYGINGRNEGYFFLTSRSWEFIIGASIKHIPENIFVINNVDNIITMLFIFLISITFHNNMTYPSYYAILPTINSFSIIYNDKSNKFLKSKVISLIGNLSYSIYLLHFPLFHICTGFIFFVILIIFVIVSYNFIELPFYNGILVMKDRQTYLFFIGCSILIIISILNMNKKVIISLKEIKHYSSAELMSNFVVNQRNYCCLNNKYINNTSSILFIGDSHIEQYIMALFNNKYNNKFLLIHIYVHSYSYNNMKKYFIDLQRDNFFPLCIIGNYIRSERVYNNVYDIAFVIKSMCKKIILSNDNPRHIVDPNACLKRNKNSCFGVLNKTCFIPKFFNKPNIINVDIVTFWDNSIIKLNKCLYYYNNMPVYSNSNHFSLFYIKTVLNRIVKIISKYVTKLNIINDSKCKYYLLSNTEFVYKNLNNQKCEK